MKSITNYKKWDIVLVNFPFTKNNSQSKRPALIISPQEYNQAGQVVILFITSNIKNGGGISIKEWKEAGLAKPAIIKMKFATINLAIILKKLGRLTDNDINEIQRIL